MATQVSPPEFIQDTIRKTLNKEVLEWFKDVTNDDDLTSPRAALKRACIHAENDSNDMSLLRMMLFGFVCGGLNQPKMWLAPEREIIQMEGHPQVILEFVESLASMRKRKAKKRHTIRASFRLLKEDFANSADETKINQLATNIKREFPKTFKHQTGQTNFAYVDKAKGFQLRIAAFKEADAREMVRKLLDCSLENVTFEEDNFSKASTKRAAQPRTKRVLGENLKVSEKRPSAIVYLKQADLFIPGYGSRLLVARGIE